MKSDGDEAATRRVEAPVLCKFKVGGGEGGNGHLEHFKPGIDLTWGIISKGNLLKRIIRKYS